MTDTSAPPLSSPEWPLVEKRYGSYRFSSEIRGQLRELNRPDNIHVPLAYLQDMAVIAASIALCLYVSPWLYPIAVVIIGARQRGIAGLLHDCAHSVGMSNRPLQMLFGTVLTAYPIFQTHYAYKVSHVYTHHPKLGNPEHDPDLRFFIEQGVYRSAPRKAYIKRVVLLPLLGRQTYAYLRYLFEHRYASATSGGAPRAGSQTVARYKRNLDVAGVLTFWIVALLAGWQFGFLFEIAIFWLVPYLTTFQLISWYIELAEHTPMIRDANVDLYMSRNRRGPWWEKFLTGVHADSYHLEHHLDPRTPFYRRAQARKVRMQDPNYAAVDRQFGGLFVRGKDGQPSAISVIIDYMSNGATGSPSTSSNPMVVAVIEEEHDGARYPLRAGI